MKFIDAVTPREFDLGNDDWKFGCSHENWHLVGEHPDGTSFYRCCNCGIYDNELEVEDAQID